MKIRKQLWLSALLSLVCLGFFGCGTRQDTWLAIEGGTRLPSEDSMSMRLANLTSGEGGRCTGILLTSKLILTAGHCLRSGSEEDLNVEIPAFENARPEVSAFQRFGDESGAFFPNFDIAWVRLKYPVDEDLEQVPILSNPALLSEGDTLALSGFGTSSLPEMAKSSFQGYSNSPHLMSVLTLSGQEKTVTSAGDSGSPSYFRHEGEWLLVGTTSGKHPILTPAAYEGGELIKSSPFFLQTFVGDYVDWIETSSGVQLARRAEISEHVPLVRKAAERAELPPPSSWQGWMNQADFRQASWATVHKLLEQLYLIGTQRGIKAKWSELYVDPEVSMALLPLLDSLPETTLGLGSQRVAIEDLRPLASLPALKFLSLSDRPYRGLEQVSQMPGLEKLEIKARFAGRPAVSGLGLDRIAGAQVRELSLQGIALSDLKAVPWKGLGALRKLGLTGRKGEELPSSALEFLPSLLQLQSLRLENWYCDGSELAIDPRGSLEIVDLGKSGSSALSECLKFSEPPH